ncbi:MAG: SpoIIE family protein phosphatase [Candidatus Omnitrophica bacterium]|nr:SpoIIE family protein phosphatase [Candidatus Omnitrophota bacterium]
MDNPSQSKKQNQEKGYESFKWPLSYMKKETYKKGDALFKAGDKADKMFYIDTGSIKLIEINKTVGKGQVIGEMGIFSPSKQRMASAVCAEDLEVYTLSKNELVGLCQKDTALVLNLMYVSFERFVENLRKETEAKERIKSELRIAQRIQTSMLPRIFPPFPERKEFEIFATMDPAREVGGDFFDFFLIGENKLGFLIGDVSGKGVPAALFMAISKAVLKTQALTGCDPDEALFRTNKILFPDNDNCMFVTLFYAVLDFENGSLCYSNGGHNPPLISVNNKDFDYLDVHSACVVGVMPEAKFESRCLKLEPGDSIFIYTDGVTEAMNPAHQLFSDERLKNCMSGLKDKDLKDIVAEVRRQIHEFAEDEPQSDDITMLTMRYKGKGE